MINPYYHEHTGITEISWPDLERILRAMAEKIREEWKPDIIIIGIARGGVIPAAVLGSALRRDFFPIKLSSRRDEEIVSDVPVWYVYPTESVRGKKVLLVDDICVAGRTLAMARAEVMKRGASEVRTMAVAIHGDSIRPDYHGFCSDELIIWPWDQDVLTDEGKWALNPEYAEGAKKSGRTG